MPAKKKVEKSNKREKLTATVAAADKETQISVKDRNLFMFDQEVGYSYKPGGNINSLGLPCPGGHCGQDLGAEPAGDHGGGGGLLQKSVLKIFVYTITTSPASHDHSLQNQSQCHKVSSQ